MDRCSLFPPSRREFFRCSLSAACGTSLSGWLPGVARAAGKESPQRCVLLWMPGGPSQLDTFDLKPGHKNGGPFQAIDTNSPGLRISEHLPKLAALGQHLAVLRGMSTKEGDHGRGTYLMRTGHQPGGPIRYPTLGSLLSRELGAELAEIPNYISIAPHRVFNREAFQPGFLGPRHAPLTVGATDVYLQRRGASQNVVLGVDDLRPPPNVSPAEAASRFELLSSLEADFVSRHRTSAPIAHRTTYERAIRLMQSDSARAFDLADEPPEVHDRYGRGRFGQGCLMARRLIERGVAFVEVSLDAFNGGFTWDTHNNNFQMVKALSAELDAGWSSLMADLHDRGLLDSTTIVWMGEFGRTPEINKGNGRDHYPKAWTAVLAGGGIRGGQAYGRTSDDGAEVEEGKTDVGDLLATLCRAVQVDPRKQNVSDVGRPIRIAEGTPVEAVLS